MNVSPAMVKVDGDAGIIEWWPEIAKGGGGAEAWLVVVTAAVGVGVAKGNVDASTTSPLGARESVVPWFVMAGPDMERVVPFTEIAVLPRGTNVSFAMVRAPEAARMTVEFPMLRVADGSRESAVPSTVIAGEPGSREPLPRMKPLLPGTAVKVCEPSTRIGLPGGEGGI